MMRIGILGYEYFGIKFGYEEGKPTSAHGGFGFLTKQKAEYLAKMGHDVHVFIPASSYDRENNANKDLLINGVNLHLYKAGDRLSEGRFKRMAAQFSQHWIRNRNLDSALEKFPVDIYQSEEPGLFTKQSLKYSNNQLIIFQDPNDEDDFKIMDKAYEEYIGKESAEIDSEEIKVGRFSLFFARKSRDYVRDLLADLDSSMVYAEAEFISAKVKRMYSLPYLPGHLPNPIDIPASIRPKSKNPSVVWIGRWDPQKRPDVALKVASAMKDIDFYFIGKATEHEVYQNRERALKELYRKYDNIHFEEFISEERKRELIEKAWILLNTSVREGIPVTFLEAMVTKTCIVSSVDPDYYASQFGIPVKNGDYVGAIRMAISDGIHKEKGQKGYEHALAVHEIDKVMKKHVDIYKRIIALNEAHIKVN